jgi:alpha-glucosidase
MIALRRSSSALATGDQRMLPSGDDVIAWVREGGGERLLVAINMSSDPATCDVAEPGVGPGRLELSTTPDRPDGAVDPRALTLGPDEGVIVRLG